MTRRACSTGFFLTWLEAVTGTLSEPGMTVVLGTIRVTNTRGRFTTISARPLRGVPRTPTAESGQRGRRAAAPGGQCDGEEPPAVAGPVSFAHD
jgi:hypothetical protein